MKNLKKYVIDYLYIIFGAFVIAVAVNCFLVPCKISTGGVSGIATMLYYAFNIPLSVTSLIINSILFFFGYKLLDKTSVVKTAVGIVFLPVFLEITKMFRAFSDDVVISSVFGGVLAGVGVGLPVLKEASTGGSDFAALMLNKKSPYISVATFILLLDAVIITISGIVFKNYNVMFYSVVSLYISSKVADNILVRGNYAKSVFIISDNYEKIAAEILKDIKRGVTAIYSQGCYNKNNGKMLMCIVKSREIPHLLDKIKEIDDKAFTIISEVREVRGEGFKNR